MKSRFVLLGLPILCMFALPSIAWDTPCLTPIPVSGSQPLDGIWQFNPAPAAEFWKKAELGVGWQPIQVPGEWALQGFTVTADAYAGYFRSFQVPTAWQGQRIKLRFDAVYSQCRVYVNGTEAGEHLGGFTPFEMDVTSQVHFGQTNGLALAAASESLADTLASGSQYAAHPLGGIVRKVVLFSVPAVHIASLHVETDVAANGADPTLRIVARIANASDTTGEPVALNATLQPCDISEMRSLGDTPIPAIAPGGSHDFKTAYPVHGIRAWDCEHPNLYMLTCRLGNGETLQKRFGFRQIEVRGNQVFVNGRPVKLRGANRHETHPLLGRSLTPDLWRTDARLFREANVNYIRTSHYPPAEGFLDACDEFGLFVEEEAPLCWVGHGANPIWKTWDPHDPKNMAATITPMLEMIERDRSHPCVLIWSLANESLWGATFEEAYKAVDTADPTRPKSFHDQAWGEYNNAGSHLPIAVYHYPDLMGPERAANGERPMLFGEYCHLNAYNREELVTDPGVRDYWGTGFAPMWEKMFASQGCLGGALWAGIDDVFLMPSGKAVGYGTWGLIDGWRRPKPEYWHVKQVYSPVQVRTKRLAAFGNGKPAVIDVANRYDFTNLRELDIEWRIGDVQQQVSADVAPREEGQVVVCANTWVTKGADLSIVFRDLRGAAPYVVAAATIPVDDADSAESDRPVPQDGAVLAVTDTAYRVTSGESTIVVDRQSGQIADARVKDALVLSGGPGLMLLPLRGGVCATEHRADIPAFNPLCTNWAATMVDAESTAHGVAIHVDGAYGEATGGYTLMVDGAGQIQVKYRFTCTAAIEPRQVGMVFTLPPAFDCLKWQRAAPWSTYPDTHIGRAVGVAYADGPAPADFREQPLWPWMQDSTTLGTNDFRSTKADVLFAQLSAPGGECVRVFGKGTQAVRAWRDGAAVRLFVADYSNGGGEPFFAAHLAATRKPLDVGTVVEGDICVALAR